MMRSDNLFAKTNMGYSADDHSFMVAGNRKETADGSLLRETLMMAEFTVENATDLIFWIEYTGKLFFANKAACQLLGYHKPEFLTMTVFDILNNYSQSQWEDHWTEITRYHTMSYDTSMKTKMKALIPVEVTFDYMNFQGIEYVCIFARDITYRKKADEKFENLHKLLMNVVSSIPGILSVIDCYYNVVYSNWPEFDTGLEIKTILGEKCFRTCKYIKENYNNCVAKVVFETKKPLVGKQVKMRNGRWMELNCFPLFDEQGNLEMVVEYVTDITAYKHAEEVIRESEERWQLALRGNSDGIWDWNVKTNEAFYSARWKEMLGFEDHELDNTFYSYTKLIHPHDIGQVMKAMNDHMKKNISYYSLEHRMMCKDGTYKWILARAQAIWDEEGNVIRMAGSHTDINERKKAEDEVRYLSFHDKLTGLYNRAYFEEELKRLDTERQLPLSIIIGDLNGLKLTNDVFGHHEGDKLLIKIADILRSSCRKSDIISRWGGDEYAIILPKTDEKVSQEICARINAACVEAESELIKPSISLGSATKSIMNQEVSQIIKEAEDRMYQHKLLESQSNHSVIISSLEKTLYERSHETEAHAQRMRKTCHQLGLELGLADKEQDDLSLFCLLHDIGKIAIADSILMKADKLTAEEWETMKKHPEIGYRIAESSKKLSHISEYILHHHERWDGTGYPNGLKGLEIPKLSRMLSIVDAYDVMTHSRIYKKAMSKQDALREINRCSGTQFDPHIAKTFIKMMSR
ncbi:HD domain-containing phosphohydrolase [Geosporobacter ferrireducens]|uniref:HD domain-containing phosphohydrolase n=1 Tax=Geosporobacter ferrireducens TaxID=1424294 RepID=UPI00139E4D24|nr:HD domain-containing phosphohydrolase [Geosporobacter ferrireducens]MTI54222.1 diguanylate cyclase [Geosporobacter ferrireducens]